MAHQTGTIAVRFERSDSGTPVVGAWVRATPAFERRDLADHSFVLPRAVTVKTDADGQALLVVRASNDPSVEPLGVTYTLESSARSEALPGIYVTAGETVQASDVAPIDPEAPQYAVQVTRAEYLALEGRVDDLEDGSGGGGGSDPATGWRDVYSDGSLLVHRVGNSVSVVAQGAALDAAPENITIPEGFRPVPPPASGAFQVAGVFEQGSDSIRYATITEDGGVPGVRVLMGPLVDAYPRWEYATTDAYPAVLPGVPA